MNDGYVARLKLVEQQIQVMRGDMNKALNEFAESMTKIMNVHRMFTVYVDTNLREIRDHLELDGKLLTEQQVPAPEDGVEL